MDKNFDLSDQLGHRCLTDVFEALGLKGYSNPVIKNPEMESCLNMKFNCCDESDLIEIDNIFKEYKKHIELNHFYFEFYILEIMKYQDDYLYSAERVLKYSEY